MSEGEVALPADFRDFVEASVPPRVHLHVRRGDYAWSAETDADGVPGVVRYRIVWK